MNYYIDDGNSLHCFDTEEKMLKHIKDCLNEGYTLNDFKIFKGTPIILELDIKVVSDD